MPDNGVIEGDTNPAVRNQATSGVYVGSLLAYLQPAREKQINVRVFPGNEG